MKRRSATVAAVALSSLAHHGDPRGQTRAVRLLTRLRPDLVTVEISPFSLRYRLKHGPRWQRQLTNALAGLPAGAADHLAIQRLEAQVVLPFEVRAARQYCQQCGVPWHPLDLGAIARRHLPRYGSELLSPANLEVLLTTADGLLADYVAAEYYRARLALRRAPRRLSLSDHSETLRRERYLGRRLRMLISRYACVAHLGGWEHLVAWEDSSGLGSDLADLKPARLLLDEADELRDDE